MASCTCHMVLYWFYSPRFSLSLLYSLLCLVSLSSFSKSNLLYWPSMASLPEHSSPGSKTVLCSFGQYSRPVLFTSTSERSDFDSLSEAISGVFGDVIPQSSRQSNVYILKMESPDWGGHLVDIREGDIIPDQSVINVLQRKEAFTRVRHSQAHRLLFDRKMLRILHA